MTATDAGTNQASQPLRRKAWWAMTTGLILVAFSTVLLGVSATIGLPPASAIGWTVQAEPAPAPGADDSDRMPDVDAGERAPSSPSAPASQAAPAASPTWAETAAIVSALGGLLSGFAGLITALVGVATMRRAGRALGRATVGD